ncbi:Short integuments 2, mitochondrial [Galdieria sulphuraria]|nr:Short integuments 2, mitochondrial [Galdieria sulphuraria]
MLRISNYLLSTINWFPGHMYKASREIKEKLALADIIIEVRDARIPLTSAAVAEVSQLPSRTIPRIILLNKADLSEPLLLSKAMCRLAKGGLKSSYCSILPFSCKQVQRNHISSVLDTLAAVPVRKRLKSLPTKVIVIGVPNVGKSSFINLLQRHCRNQWKDIPVEHTIDDGGVAKVGKHPGVTKNVAGFVVSHQPYIYMLDSPGVMYPRLDSWESGMKLIITGCIRDQSVDSIAACIDINDWNISAHQVVRKVAHRIRAFQKEDKEHTHENEDLLRTCIYILKKFRQGSLGCFTLDSME